MLSVFNSHSLKVSQILLYIYVIVLTFVVIHQVDKVRAAQSMLVQTTKQHMAHEEEDSKRMNETDRIHDQKFLKLDIERKEQQFQITVLKEEVRRLKERGCK